MSVLLLLLDVLVVALVLQLVVLGLLRLVRLARGRPRAATSAPSTSSPTGFGDPARKRRCDDCRSGWVGRPGTDASALVLRVRRSARHRAQRRQQTPPPWAAKQGWDRCPSCFSSAVRDSRHQGEAARR